MAKRRVAVILFIIFCGLFLIYRCAHSQTSSLKISPPQDGIYLGAYDWKESGQNPGVKEFEDAIGKKVAIASQLSYIKPYPDGEQSLPAFNRSAYERAYLEGYVSTFSFEFRLPNPAANTSPQSIIDGKLDNYIKQIAREIKIFNKPLFWLYPREPSIQPGYGYDGGGYGPQGNDKKREGSNPWNYNNYGCKTTGDANCLDGWERYRDACKHIHDLVEGVAPNQATWVAGASAYSPEADQELALSYPGSSYVDWVAIDYYPCGQSPDCGRGEEGREVIGYDNVAKSNSPLNKFLAKARQLAPGKPVMFVEFGVFGNPMLQKDRSTWFKEFFRAVKTTHKEIKAFMYWQMGPDLERGNFNTRVRTANAADANTWKAEIQAHPDFWVSSVEAGGENSGTPIAYEAGQKTPEVSQETFGACYSSCMNEKGNTDAVCRNWCNRGEPQLNQGSKEYAGPTGDCFSECMKEKGNSQGACSDWCKEHKSEG